MCPTAPKYMSNKAIYISQQLSLIKHFHPGPTHPNPCALWACTKPNSRCTPMLDRCVWSQVPYEILNACCAARSVYSAIRPSIDTLSLLIIQKGIDVGLVCTSKS